MKEAGESLTIDGLTEMGAGCEEARETGMFPEDRKK